MKKKLKLKTRFKVILFLLLAGVISFIVLYNKHQEQLLMETYEYKFGLLNYSDEEIKILLNNFSNTKLDELLEVKKDDLIFEILNEKYCIHDYFDEYYSYIKENRSTNISEVITIINTKTDGFYYENITLSDMSKDDLVLVNKYYSLDENYIPELVDISSKYSWGTNQKTSETTLNAFIDMHTAALEEDIYLIISSSYRDYNEQLSVYNDYKEERGERYADEIAARAGHSEHQTGLALDIFSKESSVRDTFKDSISYAWLKDNSYKYGFIIRYPEDKVDITGYNFESWHYRYVGTEVATYIYENNITFDEYYAYYIND